MQKASLGLSEQSLLGWLLVAGPALFMIGAVGWKPWDFDRPLAHALPRIAAQPLLWRWIHGWIALGVVVTAASVSSFQSYARELGERTVAPFAAALYALGAGAMLLTLTFRVTVEVAAAGQTVAEGRVPTVYLPLHHWAGMLFGSHLLLSHMAAVALGISLLRTGSLQAWVGPSAIALGLTLGTGYAALGGVFSMPVLAQIVPFILGIALLRR